jgi:uncharacterized membrane protein YdjX (TVP38/TMEM64 family)
MARYIEQIADPERPISPDAFLSIEMSGRKARFPVANAVKLAAGLAGVVGLTLAWNLTPLSALLDAKTIEGAMAELATSAWAPLYVIAAFLLGGLVALPLMLLITATTAAFGPVLGFAYAAAGSLSSAALTYLVGAWLGRRALERVVGPRLNRIRARLQRSGVFAIATIRLVPIAPFTVVNMAAGATGVALSDYILGTALGLLPGLLTLAALGTQIVDFIVNPSLSGMALLAAGVVAWIMMAMGLQALMKRPRRSRS